MLTVSGEKNGVRTIVSGGIKPFFPLSIDKLLDLIDYPYGKERVALFGHVTRVAYWSDGYRAGAFDPVVLDAIEPYLDGYPALGIDARDGTIASLSFREVESFTRSRERSPRDRSLIDAAREDRDRKRYLALRGLYYPIPDLAVRPLSGYRRELLDKLTGGL